MSWKEKKDQLPLRHPLDHNFANNWCGQKFLLVFSRHSLKLCKHKRKNKFSMNMNRINRIVAARIKACKAFYFLSFPGENTLQMSKCKKKGKKKTHKFPIHENKISFARRMEL